LGTSMPASNQLGNMNDSPLPPPARPSEARVLIPSSADGAPSFAYRPRRTLPVAGQSFQFHRPEVDGNYYVGENSGGAPAAVRLPPPPPPRIPAEEGWPGNIGNVANQIARVRVENDRAEGRNDEARTNRLGDTISV
jgi:hypothetical protein